MFHLKAHCMRNLPPLARLRTFEAAARLQSFALAAQELHLTPSAISHQIRDLERHFGRALFERRHRQVQTTQEGRRLFESLGRLFDALEATCAEVQLPTHDEVLAVHCAPSLALKWLGPHLPSFVARHPAINIRLTTGADPVDLGVVRDIDVALSYGAARHKAGLDVVSLGDERIAPLVSPGLLVAKEPASRAIQRLTLIDSQLSPVGWAEWFRAQRPGACPNAPGPRSTAPPWRSRPRPTAWAWRWRARVWRRARSSGASWWCWASAACRRSCGRCTFSVCAPPTGRARRWWRL